MCALSVDPGLAVKPRPYERGICDLLADQHGVKLRPDYAINNSVSGDGLAYSALVDERVQRASDQTVASNDNVFIQLQFVVYVGCTTV